jgi:hypothetical protein
MDAVLNLTSIPSFSLGLYSFLSNSSSIFSSNGDRVSVKKASSVASTVEYDDLDKSKAFTGDTPKNLHISITLNSLVSSS